MYLYLSLLHAGLTTNLVDCRWCWEVVVIPARSQKTCSPSCICAVTAHSSSCVVYVRDYGQRSLNGRYTTPDILYRTRTAQYAAFQHIKNRIIGKTKLSEQKYKEHRTINLHYHIAYRRILWRNRAKAIIVEHYPFSSIYVTGLYVRSTLHVYIV